jgi:integral membrane protein (TIGR01906 family)
MNILLKKNKKYEERLAPSDLGAAALALVFIYSFAVVFTLNFRPLYYAYISLTGWPESVGMAMPDMVANYEALIRYNSVFSPGPLSFPSLGLSQNGRIHYEDVKRIFVVFQIMCAASAACLAPSAIAKLRCGRTRFLRIGGIATAVSALGILLYLGLDWERFFVRFHETLFDNDYWIFDAELDPSILILPNGYFLACAIMVFALIFGLSAASILVAGRLRSRRPRHPARLQHGGEDARHGMDQCSPDTKGQDA